jgi:1-acyl-sn-glycerol-3-phosphate acyltransferase
MNGPTMPPHDARAGGRLRGILTLPVAAVFGFLYPLCLIPPAVLTPKWFTPRRATAVRNWGRFLLWLWGVKLEVHGREHHSGAGARILLFNHVSLIDLMALSAAWGEHDTVVYKKEFGKIPIIGRCMRVLGFVAVDRGDRARAKESIAEAARVINEQEMGVWIAPEGTRSRKGGLQDFKMGPFHMALATGAPLVPVISRGIEQIAPMGSLLVRPGVVRVDYLEPISTDGWQRRDLRDRAREVRRVFLQYVPPAPGSEGYEGPLG